MKTIQLNEQILRVKDDVAEEKVNKYGWKYIPRSVWKEKVRDVAKAEKTVVVEKSKKSKQK